MATTTAALATVDGLATSDGTGVLIPALRKALSEVDAVPVGDLTDDVELAEVIGRLKALTGVLLAVVAP